RPDVRDRGPGHRLGDDGGRARPRGGPLLPRPPPFGRGLRARPPDRAGRRPGAGRQADRRLGAGRRDVRACARAVRARRRVSPGILVGEDEPALADALSYALRGEGHDVETVGDGEQALEAAGAETFDALVLDLMLPGISGVEVCRRLRAESTV